MVIVRALILLGIVSVAGYLATYVCMYLARRLDVMDHPNDRKIHRRPIPYLGGLGMLAAMMTGAAVTPWLWPDIVFDAPRLQVFIVGACLVTMLGLADDILNVNAFLKLGATIGIGAWMYLGGFEIIKISALGTENAIRLTGTHWWISAGVTIGWYVVIMNAINIIDGMDGLAGGICAIASLTLLCMTLGWSGTPVLGIVLAVLVLGACLGFLPHNLPPAKIFMGDTGSLLLGMSLATLTVFSGTKVSILSALAIPVLALGIPILDIGYAFARRALQRQNPFKADRLHLHHRMIALGLPTRSILGIFYFVSAYLGLLAYMLQSASSLMILLNAALLGTGFFLLLNNLGSLDRQRHNTSRELQMVTNRLRELESATAPVRGEAIARAVDTVP